MIELIQDPTSNRALLALAAALLALVVFGCARTDTGWGDSDGGDGSGSGSGD